MHERDDEDLALAQVIEDASGIGRRPASQVVVSASTTFQPSGQYSMPVYSPGRTCFDKSVRILDLDDESLLASLAVDPYGQLSTLSSETAQTGLPIIIDEVQRLPQITLALKRIVDRDRRAGQFVLTGSSNIFTLPKALDSLAGRISSLTLRPLSAAEIQRAGPCRLLDVARTNQRSRLSISQLLPASSDWMPSICWCVADSPRSDRLKIETGWLATIPMSTVSWNET